MVSLDSYDSEGPLTPETDDSTEVRSEIFYIIHSFLNKPFFFFLSFEGPFYTMSSLYAKDLAQTLLSS